MSEARIRIVGEDAAAAVIAGVDRSVGQLTVDVVEATKRVADLKKELNEEVKKGNTASVAAISYQLDEAIPKLQQAEQELKAKLKPAVDASNDASAKWAAQLGTLNQALGLFGVGLSVGALVGFGKALLDDADALTKLRDRTGIGIEGLQRLQIAGDDAGNSVDEIATAINKFQDRLASGDTTTVGALKRIGVSLEDIQNLSADQQFMAISDAIRRVDNPAQQVSLSVDLFGQTGARVLPTLKRGFDDVKDAAVGMSTETAERLDGLGDTMQASIRTTKGYAAETLVTLVDFIASAGNATIAEAQRDIRETEALLEELQGMAKQASGPKLFDIAPKPDSQGLASFVAAERDIKAAIDESERAAKKAQDAQRRYTEETQRFAANLSDVIAKSNGYESVLDSINGNVVEAVAYYRDQGRTLGELGQMYELNETQLWALAEAEKADAAMMAQLTSGTKLLAAAKRDMAQATRDSVEALPDSYGAPSALGAGALQGGANPQLAALDFSKNFGGMLQEQLPQSVMAAIIGGGSVLQAAGSTVGSFLTSDKGLGSSIEKGLTSTLGNGLGGAVNSVMPLVGTLVGPLAGKIMSMLSGIGGPSERELGGRKVVEELEARFASATDMINRVGEAYRANGKTSEEAQAAIQRMWAAEKLGAEATRLAVAAITEELKRQQEVSSAVDQFQSQDQITHAADIANAAYQRMVANTGQYTKVQIESAYRSYQELLAQLEGSAGDAARAWLDAQKGVEAGGASASKALDDLREQRDSLAQSVANEAPEEIMGSIEAATRAQMATLNEQMKAQRTQLEAQANEAATALEDALGDVQVEPLRVPVVFDIPPLNFENPEPVQSFANEGYDLSRPMLARIGDAPGDSESVLHARTVRDIVRASRNAGAAAFNTRALEAKVEALATTMKKMTDAIQLQTTLMPMALRDALA